MRRGYLGEGLLECAAVLRSLSVTTLALALLLVAPAADGARRSLGYKMPANALEHFEFTVDHHVTTRAVELPPEAEPYDVDGLFEAIGDVRTQVRGRVERTVARVFRDRSLGLVSRVVDVQGTIDRGAGAQDADFTGIDGKSVSMRVLDSGELLASLGWEHLAGAGRGGDLVRDLLLLSVLRLPYAEPSGAGAVPSTFRLRLPEDQLLNRDQSWTLAWTAGEVPAGCKGCTALAYTGTATEAAVDRHPARPMDSESTAELSGTVVLDRRSALVEHTFEVTWTRTVRSLRENETRRAEIEQVHSVRGALRGVSK